MNGYVYEHILVAEKKLGRQLAPGEVVHHIDEDRMNNHPDNLKVYPSNQRHLEEAHGNAWRAGSR